MNKYFVKFRNKFGKKPTYEYDIDKMPAGGHVFKRLYTVHRM